MKRVLQHMGFDADTVDSMFTKCDLDCVRHLEVDGVLNTLRSSAFTQTAATSEQLAGMRYVGDTSTVQRKCTSRGTAAVQLKVTTERALRSMLASADSSSSSSSELPCTLYHGTTEQAAASIIDYRLKLKSRPELDFSPGGAFYLTADSGDAITWALTKASLTGRSSTQAGRPAVLQFITEADALAATDVCHVSADSEQWRQLIV
jgi:hypothetical protein